MDKGKAIIINGPGENSFIFEEGKLPKIASHEELQEFFIDDEMPGGFSDFVMAGHLSHNTLSEEVGRWREVKPPLGVKPRKIFEEERLACLSDAIIRYASAHCEIPSDWVEEYNERVRI